MPAMTEKHIQVWFEEVMLHNLFSKTMITISTSGRNAVLCMLLFLAFHTLQAHKKSPPLNVPKVSRLGVYQGYTTKDYQGYDYFSKYIPMRDSVMLAADIYLPKKLEKGKKVPTLLYLTRYVRSIRAKFPLSLVKDPVFGVVKESEIEFFTSFGYACVVVDVRGTGASQGERKMEFSPEEIADGNDVVNWIVKQAWSDKNVGSTGVSYLGTTAEMLLVNQNPHVKACIPRSSIFDLYGTVLFPGGVCQGPFVEVWGQTTQSLDNNDFDIFGKKSRLVKGIHFVQHDRRRLMLKEAIATHQNNFNVSGSLEFVACRNDSLEGLGACCESFSVHTFRNAIQQSKTPIYRIGGWYDGALSKSCFDGYLNTNNTVKVLVGPWDHGARNNVSPFATAKQVDFEIYTEMLRFFDYHLKGIDNGIQNEPVFSYYKVGEESFSTSNKWPSEQAKMQHYFFSGDKHLQLEASKVKTGELNYTIDYTATSGNTSRWNSVTPLSMNGPTNYANRAEECKKLLSFDAEATTIPFEISGYPVVNMSIAFDSADGAVFCYLEDVAPDGSVTYITEGMFNPQFRKIAEKPVYQTVYPQHSFKSEDQQAIIPFQFMDVNFDLLPIAYLMKKGHKLRISIAGADEGHFDFPEHQPTTLQVSCSNANPSFVELPIIQH